MGDKGVNQFWTRFDTQASQAWKQIWDHIRDELGMQSPDLMLIQKYLNLYQQQVTMFWRELCGNIHANFSNCKLNEEVGLLVLDDHSCRLINNFVMAESLAPSRLASVVKLCQGDGGYFEAFKLFESYLTISRESCNALKGLAFESAAESAYPELYSLMAIYASSEQRSPLARLLEAYSSHPGPTSVHAAIVVRYIMQMIRKTEWDGTFWGAKPEGCEYKLPRTMVAIHDMIFSAEWSGKADYCEVLYNILTSACQLETNRSNDILKSNAGVTNRFYITLQDAFENIPKLNFAAKVEGSNKK
jgi:hypothetical protein